MRKTKKLHSLRVSHPTWILLVWVVSISGCATLGLTKKEDEYDLAKRAIEGYQDSEGNYVRPEGRLAEKQRTSNMPGLLKNVPLIGTKPANPTLAKTQFQQAEETYRQATELFKQAQNTPEENRDPQITAAAELFEKAGKQFDEAGKNWISSYLHQDSLLMAAESYFFAERYPKAEDRYVRLVKDYPRTRYQDHVDKRRMEIGLYWNQFDDQFYHVNFTDKRKPWNDTAKHGIRVLEKMRLDSPTGKLADDVTMELASSHFRNQKWIEALNTYDELITTYPDSRHLYSAHLLGIKSALESYRGPDYSFDPLDKADKFFRNLKQFPEDYRRDKDEIDRMYTELVNRKAERLYNNAELRFNKGEALAARLKCEEILENFDQTAFAQPARDMLVKLSTMPDEPTPYLSELTVLFPSRDKTAPLRKPLPEEVIESDRKEREARTARLLEATPVDGGVIRR
ncbi:outer membrane protein assembly factor BamD [Pirellulaceae bacterium SH467]